MSTVEEKLSEVILSKYSSFRAFAVEIDMPTSTLNSILTRGIANATVSNILKICNTLHISADALASGKIVPQYEAVPDTKSKDIADILADARRQLLACDGLMFDGKPADPEAIESILNAMEIGMEMAKRKK